MLPAPLDNFITLRNKKVGGQDRENYIDQNVGNVFRNIACGGYRRSADGTDEIPQGLGQAVDGRRQFFHQLRRDLLRQSGQIRAGVLQIAQQRFIQIRQDSDKPVNLRASQDKIP